MEREPKRKRNFKWGHAREIIVLACSDKKGSYENIIIRTHERRELYPSLASYWKIRLAPPIKSGDPDADV